MVAIHFFLKAQNFQVSTSGIQKKSAEFGSITKKEGESFG
jgi:hypothetical protein